MINKWHGRFPLTESLAYIHSLETRIPGLTLDIVDVKGKQGHPNGFHLLQQYQGDYAIAEAQYLAERLKLPVPRLVDSPAKDADGAALLTTLSNVDWTRVKPFVSLLANIQTSPRTVRTIVQRSIDMMSQWNEARDLASNRSAEPFEIPFPSSEAPNVIVGQRLLRNPFARLWLPPDRVYQFPGLSFGGIRVENIYSDTDQPFLLDVRGVSINHHVLIDWASLEISLLLALCPLGNDGDWSTWVTLCQALSNELIPTVGDLPPGRASLALECVIELRRAVQTYSESLSLIRSLFEQSFWATLLQTVMQQAINPTHTQSQKIALKAYAALLFAPLSAMWEVNWVSNGIPELLQLPKQTSIEEIGSRGRNPLPQTQQSEIQPINARWAILVGINGYAEPNYPSLGYCVQDVQMLSQTLEQADYTTITLHDNPDKLRFVPNIDNIVAEIRRVLKEINAMDLLWIHFSCHGDIVNDKQILITQDYREYGRKDVLTVNAILDELKAKEMRRVMISLDACHMGVNGWKRGSGDVDAFMHYAHDLGEGIAILTASTSKAYEGIGSEAGIFSYYLNEGLKGAADFGRKNYVTANDLQTYVVAKLRAWRVTHGLIQEPTFKMNGMGDMILADYRGGNRL